MPAGSPGWQDPRPPALIPGTGPDHREADGAQHDRPEQVALEGEAQQPQHGDHAADDQQGAGQLPASRRRVGSAAAVARSGVASAASSGASSQSSR